MVEAVVFNMVPAHLMAPVVSHPVWVRVGRCQSQQRVPPKNNVIMRASRVPGKADDTLLMWTKCFFLSCEASEGHVPYPQATHGNYLL